MINANYVNENDFQWREFTPMIQSSQAHFSENTVKDCFIATAETEIFCCFNGAER
ncbi:hypothetical protein TUM17377_38550 [Shewanella chilikensis]|jgi:hypothetical protein|nr:hypothetical protein TUM17377_38550 [Shewanella chilikensis]